MINKKFILGIGSQRAGSTFVAELLNKHPKIALHPLKELHYFDTLFDVRDERTLKNFSRDQLSRELDALCTNQSTDFINHIWKWYVRSNFTLYSKSIAEIDYSDLFSDANKFEDITFTGESTPEYMLLESEEIQKIQAIVGDAYILLVCRNPIKRVISSFRLMLEYSDQKLSQTDADQLFLGLVADSDIWLQTQMKYNNYKGALAKYRKIFSHVLCLNYDDMVEDPYSFLWQLSQFLNLDFNSESMAQLFRHKVNVLSVEYVPSQEVFEKLSYFLEPQVRDTNSLFNRPVVH